LNTFELYEPSEETRKLAWVNNKRIYEMAQDYLTFWDEVAKSDVECLNPLFSWCTLF